MQQCTEELESEAARSERQKEDLRKELESIGDDASKLADYNK